MAPRLTQRVWHRFGNAAPADGGFTVLEVVVSIVIFVIAATAAGSALVTNVSSSRLTQERVRAASMAQSFLAGFQSSKTMPASLPTSGPDGYSVSISLNPGLAAACATGSSRTVSVLIFAPGAATTGTPIARTDGVIAC
jgi:prepilin-type N-terminal cleavage/methylation domain-containing protein